ncbi:MAG: molybdate ABC transporter substrate-binding protein [Myxococcales bacterium]|nr:molybdate ABC transporter substrate-binding protein [Myxococcales bacterium]
MLAFAAAVAIQVAAASDLQFALPEIAAGCKGVDARISYGSSGLLYAQIVNGAPIDVYLSADVAYPRKLAKDVFVYAVGQLVLWSSKIEVDKGPRALLDRGVRRVAIANPDHAPYGRAAVEALKALGIYDQVQPKLVFGENVGQAAQFAESGNVDAALLPLSHALRMQGRYQQIAHPGLEQGGAILSSKPAARAFVECLTGPGGRAILQRHGFGVP